MTGKAISNSMVNKTDKRHLLNAIVIVVSITALIAISAVCLMSSDDSDAAIKEEEFNRDGFTFRMLSDSEVEVRYNINDKYTGDIVVPSTVTYGKTVYNVTRIGNSAFSTCKGLKSVTLPLSVKSIGWDSFKNNPGLVSMDLPNVETIGSNAFEGCTNLECITFSDNLKTIEYDAFLKCTSLVSITIPCNVTSIGDSVFNECSALISINVASENTAYCSEDGILFNKTKTALIQYPQGKTETSYSIPDGVKTLEVSAFANCSTLSQITIPDGLNTIRANAFSYCSSITAITLPDSTTYIGEEAFLGCTSLATINIPNNVETIDDYAFAGCTSITSIIIPSNTKIIGIASFAGCTSLTEITVSISNQKYSSVGGVLFDKTKTVLCAYPAGRQTQSYTLPSSVTSIYDFAFYECSSLTSVTIGTNVTRIGVDAFYGCTSLVSIDLSDSITYIGRYAFEYCSSLTLIHIPNKLTDIHTATFYGCSSLTSVTIPDNVTVIWHYAFEGCTSVTTLTIGSGVSSVWMRSFADMVSLTTINYNATDCSIEYINGEVFSRAGVSGTGISLKIGDNVQTIRNGIFYTHGEEDVYNIKSVSIGSGLTSIGNYVFYTSSTLTEFIVSEDNTTYCSENGVLFNKAKTELIQYPTSKNDASYEIPSTVEIIDNYAFRGCTLLTSITFSENITKIDKQSFEGCTALEEIKFNATDCDSIYGDTFCNAGTAGSGIVFTTGNNVTKLPYHLFDVTYPSDSPNIISVDISDSVQTIGQYAFSSSKTLKTVTIGSGLKSGVGTFNRCPSLVAFFVNEDNTTYSSENGVLFNKAKTELIQYPASKTDIYYIIPESVNTVSSSAFSYCFNLESLTILSGITKICNFYRCTSLITVYIPITATSISNDAFSGCSSLTTINIPNSVTSIGEDAFENCTSLISIDIPNSVTSIGRSAFEGCTSLNTITLPNSIKILPMEIFRNCSSLTTINIPNSVTSIDKYAFEDCTSLISIDIPNSVTSVNSSAFRGCSSLNSVTLPNSISIIRDYTFCDCTSLASLDIPKSVTGIGSCAFEGCTALSSIYIPYKVSSIGMYAFSGCESLTYIAIPNVVLIGNKAFAGCTFYDCDGITEITDYSALPYYIYSGVSASKLIRQQPYPNVHFDENRGPIAISDIYVEDGDSFTLPHYSGTIEHYYFSGWLLGETVYKAGTAVTKEEGGVTYTAVWKPIQYSITFMNEDKVYETKYGTYGSIITAPSKAPTKTSTAQYDYTFKNWDGFTKGMTVTGDISFSAVFTETTRYYSVVFKSDDTIVESNTLMYGSVIIKPVENPTKASTAQYDYTFSGWNGFTEGMTVTGEHCFDAVYNSEVRNYSVKFISEGSTVKSECLAYGTVITKPVENPIKSSTVQYEYTFSGWNGFTEGMTVTGEHCFDAVFNETVREYDVEFISDGSTVKSECLAYGTVITKPATNPVKTSTAQYDYSFSGWNGFTDGMTVSGEHSFDAVYNSTVRNYNVKFISEDSTIKSENLDYGTVITKPFENPIKSSTVQYEYTFSGWNGFTEGMTVTGEHCFDAVFNETVREYSVVFMDLGKVYHSYKGGYGSKIVLPSNPTRSSTENCDYKFLSWKGYSEEMVVTGYTEFESSFEMIVKNIDTTGDKVTIDSKTVSDLKVTSGVVDKIISAGKDGKDTTIDMSNGMITIDSASASSLQSGEKTISFVEADKTKVPADILKKIGERPVYSISIGDVHEFNGKLTISIKYTLHDGETADKVCIWYLKSDGTYEKIACNYADGYATFTTTHLSDYAVMIDTEQPAQNNGMNIGLIAGIVVGAIVLIGAVIFFVRKH